MTKPNSTEIVFVIDRSGSMKLIAAAMCQGFDELINNQKKLPGECRVTVAQFDDHYEVLYTARPLSQVPKFVLEPRSTTALYDAVARTILETGYRLEAMREDDRPSQVLFVIVTDGIENASREFPGEAGRKRLAEMIKHQRETYSWDFVFLGANQDAFAVGVGLGISGTNAVTYDASLVGAAAVMDCLNESVRVYRESGKGSAENIVSQRSYSENKSRRRSAT